MKRPDTNKRGRESAPYFAADFLNMVAGHLSAREAQSLRQAGRALLATDCPVTALMHETAAIIEAIDAIDMASDRRNDSLENPLHDRLDAIKTTISYMTARSLTGAAFQLAVAHAEADVLFCSVYTIEPHEKRRRTLRLIQAVMRFLIASGADLHPRVEDYFANSDLDAIAMLARGRKLAAKRSEA